MEYAIEHNGEHIKLPRYNFDIDSRIERLSNPKKTESVKNRMYSYYAFIEELLDKEVVEELIGKFNDCDPNDIVVVYQKICSAYAEPVNKYQQEQMMGAYDIDELERLLRLVEKSASLGK